MDLFLALCQGLGLALAIGIGGALAALFASMMASLELGFDPDGTDFAFVAETWFLVTLLAVVVLATLTRGYEAARRPVIVLLAAAGALAFAASMAEEGQTAIVGLILGAAIAGFTALLASEVLGGAIQRASASDEAASATNTLILTFTFTGIALAAVSLFVPPLSLVAAIGLVIVFLGRRRRADEKYEGLRILR